MRLFLGVLLLAVAAPGAFCSSTVFIAFETFPDGTVIADSIPLTTQFPGLSFFNTTVITAGITLNEFEFPPHSGSNVAFDDGGPIFISFDSPILSFSAYFTYAEPLTLAAFDSTSAQVASAVSLFSNNEALSGDTGSSPNEFLEVRFDSGISSVTIMGDPAGGSFVMDDVTYTTSQATVPEPNSLILLLTCIGGLLTLRKRLL